VIDTSDNVYQHLNSYRYSIYIFNHPGNYMDWFGLWCLMPLSLVSHEKAPVVIHGTYQSSWEKIKLTVSFIFMYMNVSEIY
jgi:hypothetical protein